MILYQNVSQYEGKMINLKVENISAYSGNTSKNYLLGDFAQINVDPDSQVMFKLTMLDDETNDTIVIPRFSVSFWDFDAGKDMGGTESLEIGPVDTYFTANKSQVIAEESDWRSGLWKFTASERGSLSDNPESLFAPTDLQLSRAVEVDIVMKPHIYLSYSVTPNKYGRNFLMAGRSKLRFMNANVVGDCAKARAVNFANPSTGSLAAGGSGIRVSDFTQTGNESVDLIVTADDRYQAYNASKNGVIGDVFNLNLADNTTSQITLSFVKASTDEPVELGQFFITFLDVDSTHTGFEEVAVRPWVFDHYVLSTKSNINVKSGDRWTAFRSGSFGTEGNNPNTKDDLITYARENAVALWIRDPISKLEVSLKTENIWTGRNFEIAGNTPFSCPLEEAVRAPQLGPR
jgi:hypothetical protein